MANTDKRKQSLYFPEEMLNEIQREAVRLDRSLSSGPVRPSDCGSKPCG